MWNTPFNFRLHFQWKHHKIQERKLSKLITRSRSWKKCATLAFRDTFQNCSNISLSAIENIVALGNSLRGGEREIVLTSHSNAHSTATYLVSLLILVCGCKISCCFHLTLSSGCRGAFVTTRVAPWKSKEGSVNTGEDHILFAEQLRWKKNLTEQVWQSLCRSL